jgi:N-sulfoglucosamine sulfohydrolase
MKRIIILLVTCFLILACDSKKEPIKKPNILFAIADDASWKHFSAYGCNWVKTAAFDKVAKNGVLFNNAYTPNAKCAPSRAVILTGRNSWQLEEAANHSPYFPAKFKTYPEALKENGYFVGSVAKGWAPGDPGKINGKKRELTGTKFDKYKTKKLTKGISDNDYAKNFEDFLAARDKGQPFCFWFGSQEPHRSYEFESGIKLGGKSLTDIEEVPSFWPDVDSIRADMLDYAMEVEYFDSHLQRMLEKLEEVGELDNTIVVVTADNGMPFPRIKGQVYEYSNHLPLAIMWPNGIKKPGRVVDDIVSFADFTPTFLDLAGLSNVETGMQKVTGESLLNILNSELDGQVDQMRNYQLVGKERHDVGRPNDEGYPVRGILKGDYLYLHNYKTDRWPIGNPETGYLNTDGSPTKSYILDTRRQQGDLKYWQWNFGKRVDEELYNIKKDPYCMANLVEDAPLSSMKADMRKLMIAKLTEQGDPRILGNGDIFDQYEYAGAVKDYYNRFMKGENVSAGWVNPSDFETDF